MNKRRLEKIIDKATKVQAICILTILLLATIFSDINFWQVLATLLLFIPFEIAHIIRCAAEDELEERRCR